MPKLKLGPQCQEKEVYRYNRELRPVVVKSINILDPGHYTRLAAENPGVQLVYRQVPNGPWNGAEDGRKWAEHLFRLVGHIPEITLVEGHNEWIHAPPHNSPEDFERADLFMFAFISWVHELWDDRVHAVVLNASCGHFNEDIVDFFPRTLARLQLCGKCLLALHEYDHPDQDMIGDGAHNLCGKFLRNLAGLRTAGYDKVRIAITECGVDSGVGVPAGSGHVGFKYWGENAAARYLDGRNLGWYIPLAQETEGVAWLTIFGCGMEASWGSFDIKDTPVIEGIGQIYSDWSPPEPPNGGSDVIRVFDLEGNELLGEAALDRIAFHGIAVHQPQNMRPGEWYWAVVKMRESIGPACFIYTGLLEDGSPAVRQGCAWAWTDDMGEADDIKGNNYPTDWQQEADLGVLNDDGNMGPAYGQKGWFHAPYEPGPGRAWIRDPLRWAVLLTGMGMLDMTNHHTMFATWQLKQWPGGELPEPPTDGVLDKVLAVVEATKADTEKILRILDGTEPPPPPEKKTFTVQYFNSVDLSGAVVCEMEEPLLEGTPFFWHDWFAASPAPSVDPNNWSARWTGVFTFGARAYTFNIRVDDGARLYIDDKLELDLWKDQSATTYSKSILLTAGEHKVVVEYYERSGDAILHVNWV